MTLVTIIIPTHNRQVYAAAAVHKIVQVLPSAQIVVSDTSADDDLRTMLPAATPGLDLAYVRPGRPMDVVSHFEFALGHARGRYVMFLGDDDCIGPGLEEVAAWADCNRVDAVFSYGTSFIANYFWPGVKSRFYGDGYASSLFVHPFTGTARRIDPIAALRETLRDFGRGLGTMPRAYHGLVSLELIHAVKARFGTLFGGVSPDIYSATLLSEFAGNVWQVDFPFCLPGGSPSSTAGTGAAGTDMTSLEDNPHTAAFPDLRWDRLIPAFYAPYIVWAYSLKKAVDRLGRPDLTPNFARLYALALMRNREQRGKVAQSFAEARALGIGWRDVGWEMARETGFQARRYATRLTSPGAGGRAAHFTGLPDIAAGYDRLERYIAEREIRLQLPAAGLSASPAPVR
ncbi:glycosyltransferase [Sphingomonas sp. SUN019]|uniref:glycosyltransferase n=1 Tax=Sphingomonas sp. SUN019 TaxID=2937788 RepID=UPI002164E15F|nr:glycosyltransferase [Sphingomonas sp. SUN019]UVO50927.1 glycosyltransferase [Sphingomonas sp. SUN019]